MREYLSFLPAQGRSRRARPAEDPADRRDESLLDLRPGEPAPGVRRAQARQGGGGPRRASSSRSRSGRGTSSPRWRASAGRPSGSWRTTRAHRRHPRRERGGQGRAFHANSATPSPSRWSSSRTFPGSWWARRSSSRDHPARGEDAPRVSSGHRAQDHRGRAQGIWRGLLRDERARLRAGPPGRLARRRRSA